MTVAERIAEWMESMGMRHVFGIIGAGNAAIFDAIHCRKFTQIVCCHHEQACVMAANAYYRVSGTVGCALVTTGGGAANAITGVVAANMDSVPVLVISGNEKSTYAMSGKRAWGVQGFDLCKMVTPIVKHFERLVDPNGILSALSQVNVCMDRRSRQGPMWLDIPQDVQQMAADKAWQPGGGFVPKWDWSKEASELRDRLSKATKPVLWLGAGIRSSGAVAELVELLEHWRIPSLLSWSGADLLDSEHPLVMGRAGVYGQRCANFVVQSADLVVAIGTRMAIPQVGYDTDAFAPIADIFVVDVDQPELDKFKAWGRPVKTVCADAGEFIKDCLQQEDYCAPKEWIERCVDWRLKYPWFQKKDHRGTSGGTNSYEVMGWLRPHLKEDQVIVTDMGAALLSSHQALMLKPPQRLITSYGLGEMGCSLPFAVGASFARTPHVEPFNHAAMMKGEVLCLTTDGGMMFNLQELATIVHQKLPVKIMVFCNDGYGMIKQTQKVAFGGRMVGVDAATGVWCPDFEFVARSFHFPWYERIRNPAQAQEIIPKFLAYSGPALLAVRMSPDQAYLPKLVPVKNADGSLSSPPLEDLSPPLWRKQLKEEMG